MKFTRMYFAINLIFMLHFFPDFMHSQMFIEIIDFCLCVCLFYSIGQNMLCALHQPSAIRFVHSFAHFLLLHGRALTITTATTAAHTHTHSLLFAFLLLVHDDDQGIKVTILIHFFYCWLLRFFILPSCVQPFHACMAVSIRARAFVCARFFLICWRIFIFTRKNWVLFGSKQNIYLSFYVCD